jgi:hypothetical protein
MNPGITEEAAKVITHSIDALKAQPMVFAVLLFNALILGVILWGSAHTRAQQNEIVRMIVGQNAQFMGLLEKCFKP